MWPYPLFPNLHKGTATCPTRHSLQHYKATGNGGYPTLTQTCPLATPSDPTILSFLIYQ